MTPPALVYLGMSQLVPRSRRTVLLERGFFLFFIWRVFKNYFMYKEIAFCHEVDVLNDPFMEGCLVQLDECLAPGTDGNTGAHVEAVLPGQTLACWADAARTGTQAEFPQSSRRVAGTHLALSVATRQKGERGFLMDSPFSFSTLNIHACCLWPPRFPMSNTFIRILGILVCHKSLLSCCLQNPPLSLSFNS